LHESLHVSVEKEANVFITTRAIWLSPSLPRKEVDFQKPTDKKSHVHLVEGEEWVYHTHSGVGGGGANAPPKLSIW